MATFLIWVFVAGAFWDVTTSFLGMVGIFGVTDFHEPSLEVVAVIMTALVGSFFILGLGLNAERIWTAYTDINYKLLRPVHAIAVLFDAYTSYLGTAQNILLRNSRTAFVTIGLDEVFKNLSFDQQLVLIFVTVVVTISPIMLSTFNNNGSSRAPKRLKM